MTKAVSVLFLNLWLFFFLQQEKALAATLFCLFLSSRAQISLHTAAVAPVLAVKVCAIGVDHCTCLLSPFYLSVQVHGEIVSPRFPSLPLSPLPSPPIMPLPHTG